jgi:hypothetical protein
MEAMIYSLTINLVKKMVDVLVWRQLHTTSNDFHLHIFHGLYSACPLARVHWCRPSMAKWCSAAGLLSALSFSEWAWSLSVFCSSQ